MSTRACEQLFSGQNSFPETRQYCTQKQTDSLTDMHTWWNFLTYLTLDAHTQKALTSHAEKEMQRLATMWRRKWSQGETKQNGEARKRGGGMYKVKEGKEQCMLCQQRQQKPQRCPRDNQLCGNWLLGNHSKRHSGRMTTVKWLPTAKKRESRFDQVKWLGRCTYASVTVNHYASISFNHLHNSCWQRRTSLSPLHQLWHPVMPKRLHWVNNRRITRKPH